MKLLIACVALVSCVLSQKARIKTLDEWQSRVEELTANTFAEILPKQGQTPSEQGIDRFHLYLLIYGDECVDATENPFFLGVEYRVGPGMVYTAQIKKSLIPTIESDWNLQPNCSHLIFIPKKSRYEDVDRFSIAESMDFRYLTSFIGEWSRASVTFVNRYGKKLDQLWWNKDEKPNGELMPGEQTTIGTFLGHIFLWRDSQTGEVVNMHVVEEVETTYNIYETEQCTREGITDAEECRQSKERFLYEEAYEFWAQQRADLNWIQPQLFPYFDKIGFKKERLPDDVFAQIRGWYDAHKPDPATTEPEYLAGPVLNQLDSKTFMAHLEPKERNLFENHMRGRLEKWSGLSPLRLTSLYGIRMYTRGAYLGMHVDTCTTHVISAILNVDQKVDEDWPLQIYDHNGTMHSIIMSPGDVVFYESATCNHARQEPMIGDEYANVFIHYAPVDSKPWDCGWF